MDGKYEVRREENWMRDVVGTHQVYATLIVRPLCCPLGLSLLNTDCTGCDEYNGLTFVSNADSSGFRPVVNCMAQHTAESVPDRRQR